MSTPITDPPKLDLDRYTEWKHSVICRSDAPGDSPGSHLVGKLALSSAGALGILIAKYLRESAHRPDTRNLEEVIVLADKDPDLPDHEATPIAISQMIGTHRKPNANLRLFWLRFFKMHGRLVLNNAAFPSTVLFSRALEALNLTSSNRSMILSALDARAQDPTATDLKEVPVRFSHSFGEPRTVMLETTDADAEYMRRGDHRDAQFWGQYEQVMISKCTKPPRNHPGGILDVSPWVGRKSERT